MADVIGVTGYTLQQIGALTYPQLQFLVRQRGRILWPRLQPHVEAAFANVSDEPAKKGELSGVQRLIRDHELRRAGTQPNVTQQQRQRQYAWRVFAAPYLGDPDAPQPGQSPARQRAQPYPGMGRAEARAWVAWVEAGKAGALWTDRASGLAAAYPAIYAAAHQGGEL